MPLAGLNARQRTNRASGASGCFGQRESAGLPEASKSRTDGVEYGDGLGIHSSIFAVSANRLGAGAGGDTRWISPATSSGEMECSHGRLPPLRDHSMKALLLGARGAVGTVIRRELEREGVAVTAASRSESSGARIDLRGDLASLTLLAATHDVVINASGIERADLATATGATALVDISATGSYLEVLRMRATGPVVLGAGLVPGLSTVLAGSLATDPGDDIDVFVMLGSGERHGPAAVAWTAGLVGTDLYQPPEAHPVRNFLDSARAVGPDGRTRRYLRADFPDHILLREGGARIRTYLTLGSTLMTGALDLIGRMPMLRGALKAAPHMGSDAWHVIAQNRRTGERYQASGRGQSEATGRLTALVAMRVAASSTVGAVTTADLVTVGEALNALAQ